MLTPEERKPILRGSWFQLPMMVVWGIRGMSLYGSFLSDLLSPYMIVSNIGFIIMAITMFRIYRVKRSKRKLITSDVFAVTRHPMYHGMFITDAAAFLVADLSQPLFWASWILFVILLCTLGWYQEKETLARWNGEAQAYYARTPRFIFEWLWWWT